MPKKRFVKLLEPGYIGNVRTRNRMIKTGAGTSFIEKDGTVGDAMRAFYESLARGGVGLIIVESCGVDFPLGIHHLSVHAHLEDDKYIPSYAELTKVIHKHGCPVFIQLFHSGPWHPFRQTGLTPIASSDLSQRELEELKLERLHGLSIPEVEITVDKFVAAAMRAREAGFDGVEINANSSHLIDTFLSRAWNRRQDCYGYLDLASRSKFLTDIIKTIKRRAGQDFAVSVLITGLELGVGNGIAVDEAVGFGRIIQDAGADAIQTRAFGYNDYQIIHPGPERLLFPERPAKLPTALDWSRGGAGAFVPLAAALKSTVHLPVIAVGRLDHELGEKVLEEGKADFIGLHRRLLADPELPIKVAEGRLDDIAPCTACYYCWNERINNRQIRCRINASLGRERELAIRPAQTSKRVLVVGGGPAGMEAARVAALRGHEVLLFEKQSKLGGSLLLAGIIKGFEIEDMYAIARYLSHQVAKLGVKINLGKEATPELITGLKPDVVVLATGGVPKVPDIPGINSGKVMNIADLHRQLKLLLRFIGPKLIRRLTQLWMPIGKNVVVIGGGLHGCQLAEFLVTRSRRVTIVETSKALGEGIVPLDTRERLLNWLGEKGVAAFTGVRYESINDEGINIVTKDGGEKLLLADTIIPAMPLIPNIELYKQLKSKGLEVYQVGDCREPKLTAEAIADGAMIGHKI